MNKIYKFVLIVSAIFLLVNLLPNKVSAASSSCSSASPEASYTYGTTGSFRASATGVSSNTTQMFFITWSDIGGFDDRVDYPGINDGGGNWHVDINLASHPGPDHIQVEEYMFNAVEAWMYCGSAAFSKVPPLSVDSLTATPTSVGYGGSSTISWNTTSASSCALGGSDPLVGGPSGTYVASNLTATKTFALSCNGLAGGNTGKTVTVTVLPLPTPDIKCNGQDNCTATSGDSVNLSWSTVPNATSCSLFVSNNGTNFVDTGTRGVTQANIPTGVLNILNGPVGAYRLDCSGAGGTASDTTTITLNRAAPTVNLTMSSNTIRPDNSTQYDIIVSGTDPAGAKDITWQEALINYQGSNAASYRGFLVYHPSASYGAGYFTPTGYTDVRTCAGVGGMAGVYPGTSYGSQYIHLDSCATTDSGNTRSTVFTVHFDQSFTSPTTGNDISAYTHDGPSGLNTGWVNFDLNFSVAQKPTPDIKCNVADACTVDSGTSVALSWATVPNATSCELFVSNDGINFITTGTKGASWISAANIPTGTLSLVNGPVGAYRLDCTGPGGSASDTTTITLRRVAPTVNLTMTPGPVKADNITQYNINVSGTDPAGAKDITWQEALINYQGANAGAYRGFLVYNPSIGSSYFTSTGYKDMHTCTGVGGLAGVYPDYGPQYIHLDSCATTDSGNTRSTVFTVHFDPSFTSPTTDNDISAYTHDGPSDLNTGWINFDLNFSVAQKPTPVLKCDGQLIDCNHKSGESANLSWTTVANATSCELFVSNDGTNFVTTGSKGPTFLSATNLPTGVLNIANGSVATYRLDCTGAGGIGSSKINIAVSAAPLPTPDIKCNGADACTVDSGTSVALSWATVPNATSCELFVSNDGTNFITTGTKGASWISAANIPTGTLSITNGPVGAYRLDCTGPGGSASDTTTITLNSPIVVPPPDTTPLVLDVMSCAGPDGVSSKTECNINSGQSVTFSWSTTFASPPESCTLYKNDVSLGVSGLNGSYTTIPLSETVLENVYNLRCFNSDGTPAPGLGSPRTNVLVAPDNVPMLTFPPPAQDIITSPDGNVKIGVSREAAGSIVFYSDKRIPLSPLDVPENLGNIVDYTGTGALFQSPMFIFKGALNGPICPPGSDRCSQIKWNNPTQAGYSTGVNPNPSSVLVHDNIITVSTRLVNYNYAFFPSERALTEANRKEWQTDVWQDIDISFHPTLKDVVVVRTKTTYCKDNNIYCKDVPITTQDNQLMTLFAAGQRALPPEFGGRFNGPYIKTAFFDKSLGDFVFNKDGTKSEENWMSILQNNNKGIGVSVENPGPGGRYIAFPETPSIAMSQPNLSGLVSSGVSELPEASEAGQVYDRAHHFVMQPGGSYTFTGYVATGDLDKIRWDLLRAGDFYTPDINGSIDTFDFNHVTGWARDERNLPEPLKIEVDIYDENGTLLLTRTGLTNNVDGRSDLAVVCPPNGACLFDIPLNLPVNKIGFNPITFKLYGIGFDGQKSLINPNKVKSFITYKPPEAPTIQNFSYERSGYGTQGIPILIWDVQNASNISIVDSSSNNSSEVAFATTIIPPGGFNSLPPVVKTCPTSDTCSFVDHRKLVSSSSIGYTLTATNQFGSSSMKVQVGQNGIGFNRAPIKPKLFSLTNPTSFDFISNTGPNINACLFNSNVVLDSKNTLDDLTCVQPTGTRGKIVEAKKFANGNDTYAYVDYDTGPDGWVPVGYLKVVNQMPPTVSMDSPANNTTVPRSTSVRVSANAQGVSLGSTIAGVKFYVNNVQIGIEDTVAPFTAIWDTSALANNSAHRLTAEARDNDGNKTLSRSSDVTISDVVITDLQNGSSIPVNGLVGSKTYYKVPVPPNTAKLSIETIMGTGDLDIYVSRDQLPVLAGSFISDFRSAGPTSKESVIISNPKEGDYYILIDGWKEYTSTLSINLTPGSSNVVAASDSFLQLNSADTNPPKVFIFDPIDGTTITNSTTTLTLKANATDDVGVSGVQFKLDGVNLGAESTTAPYSVNMDTTTLTNASHTITAIARDDVGNSTTSDPVIVSVNTVTVPPPAPDLKCAGADSCTVVSGASATLSWATVSNATSCSLLLNSATTPATTGIANASFSTGVLNFSSGATATYKLDCTGPGGTGSDSVVITVSAVAPSVTLTTNFTSINPDNTTQYEILVNGTDTTGAGNLTWIEAALNSQGDNAGNYRGLLVWHPTDPLSGYLEIKTCNIGHAGIYSGDVYGGKYIHLDSCVVSDIGNTRSVTFKVHFDPTFTSPTTNNDISGYVYDGPTGLNTGWVNSDINFSVASKPTPDLKCNNLDACGANFGESVNLSWTTVANATSCLLSKGGVDTGTTGLSQTSVSSGALNVQSGGTVNFTLTCTGPGGSASDSTIVTMSADTTAPSVSITAPAASATVSGASVTVSATATDNIGVSGVQFKLDGANLGSEDTSSPYSVTWDTATATNASHSITAVARDAAGNTKTSTSVSVTVNNVVADITAPVVSLTAPAASSTVSGSSTTVSATATDNVGVVGVQFKLDGVNLGSEDTTSPYSTTWNTTGATNGAHSLTALARDAAGNTTVSSAVSVNVNNVTTPPPDTTTPTVSISAPSSGATVLGSSTSVTATATDNVGIVGVQFKLDGANLGSEDTSSPYSKTFDTTTTTNGSHALTAVARDAAGNTTTSSTVNVTVNNVTTPPADTTPPTVSISAPTAGSTVSGSSTVSAAASDGVGVVGVQFKLDGANLGTEDLSSPYSTTWNTTTATNAPHSITAVARDAAGNVSTSSSVSVTVNNVVADTTPPTVSITAPAASATVSGASASVTATASDNVGVSGVQFKLDGANLGSEDTSSPYSKNWDTTTATNGTHTITAVARDAAGNVSTSSGVSVTVNNVTTPSADTTTPTVSMSAPSSRATVSGSSTAVSATATDNVAVVGVQFKLDGANLGSEDTSSPYSITWNTTSATNGSHTITAVARDAAGNTKTSSSRTVTVSNTAADTTAPTVSVTAPTEGATVSGSNVTLSATASDNKGVAGVQFKVDGVNRGSEDTSSPYSKTWDTTSVTNGAHTITAVARDAAGNTTTSNSRTVTVSNVTADTTLPTVSVTAPAAGATVSGSSVSLTASASDNIGVVGVQFKVDGANRGSEDTSSPYSKTWDTTTATNGTHTITAVARDAAGNTKTSTSVTVTVNNVLDTTAPTVSITAPASGATVSGSSVSLNATASDNIAVVGVQFKVDGANRGSEDTSAPYSKNWDTTTVANGTHTITAVARDAAGNTKTSTAVTVTVTGSTAEADSQNFLVAAAVLMGDAVIDVFDFFSSLLSF